MVLIGLSGNIHGKPRKASVKTWMRSKFSNKWHMNWLSSRKMAFWLFLAWIWTRAHNTLHSSWACFSLSFLLPCINYQALISTISWNQWRSCWACFWTNQESTLRLSESFPTQNVKLRVKQKAALKYSPILDLLASTPERWWTYVFFCYNSER